jgi:hypothetical protein
MAKDPNDHRTISMAELKLMLNIYDDSYDVYFGGLDLVKLDDHDTKVVSFIWGRHGVHEDFDGNVVAENH